MITLFNPGKSTKLSVITDPFKADKIRNIMLFYRKGYIKGKWAWYWEGDITFQNGNTEGKQRFEVYDSENYNSFEKITKEMQEFINSL
jgi:hypothetical protein